MRARWRGAVAAAILGGIALLAQGGAEFAAAAADEQPRCAAAPELVRLGAPLPRTSTEIAEGKPVTILAAGSSSTQGVGASNPAMSYPSRLAGELQKHFPAAPITIVNHGRRGLDASEELAGLDRDQLALGPDLVIWQVGTNALLRGQDPAAEDHLITQGVDAIKRQGGADIVLMDLQYAPRVLARPNWAEMERVIAAVSRRERVGYFRRFEMMRQWAETGAMAASALTGPDGLHMTDTSYGCLAEQLAQALAGEWQSQAKIARSPKRNPAALAHSAAAGAPN
jgi:acyl-CoA thioesterase-1